MTVDSATLSPTDVVDAEVTATQQPILSYRERKARRQTAMGVVKKYMLIAGGVGAIPASFFDQMTIGALLAKMTYDLSKVYEANWTDHKVKVAVASVLGGAHTQWITYYLVSYMNKISPVTPMTTLLTRPLVSAAIVYTIGKLFVKHFESGAWLKHKDPV